MRVASFVMSLADTVLERDVAVNEVFGFVMRCALQSAGHTTDYVIDEGTAFMMGGPRTPRLLELALKAGYLKRKRIKGLPTYTLVDIPEFIHMRTKEEIDRDRNRKADNANGKITGAVRFRDGDECRYCGVVVNWDDRKSNRGGTYDARGGHPATVGDLVVACQACNGGRGNDPNADERYPMRPTPAKPVYSATTAAFLEKRGYVVEVTEGLRPGSQPDHARDSASSGTTHTPTVNGRAPVTATPRPAHRATSPPRSADPADIEHPGSGFAGTGRDGPGLGELGSGGGVARGAAPVRRARRSKRGRR